MMMMIMMNDDRADATHFRVETYEAEELLTKQQSAYQRRLCFVESFLTLLYENKTWIYKP
jgi:hypothetical protein